MTTKERAIAMLDRRDYSRRELINKLIEKGEDADEAEAVADRLVEIGFVDDERYAGLLVRHYAGKGYGLVRVKNELQRRGIPKELWDAALEHMPEQDDALDKILRSKLKSEHPDRAEIKKASDAAMRRGYTWGEIKSALERYHAEIEDYVE